MTIIVGAGLAGACAALWLAEHGPVTVLEAERPAAGASGAAAGLVNPLMGQKANPAWRAAEALHAFHATLDRAGATDLFRPGGVLRPARGARQAETFRQRAEASPDMAHWRPAESLTEPYPDLHAPHGALLVSEGGAVDLDALTRCLLDASGATLRTGVRVVSFGETEGGAWVDTAHGERLLASRLLLAPGDGFRHFPALAAFPLHRIKGQTVRVIPPPGLGPVPVLSGFGYVVPDCHAIILGSTYEHDFQDLTPTAAASSTLVRQATRMVPALAEAVVTEARTGVRVTVPGAVSPKRLPLIGPLPGHEWVWAFTGLGSKGLLTAPLLAHALPRFFRDPASIPPEVRLS